MRDLRFASVGGWHLHTDRFLVKVREYPGCSVCAVWDPDPIRGRERAKTYGCMYVDSYEKLLEDATIDGLIITSPPKEHYVQIEKAIVARKHVFVEKPAFVNVSEAYAVRKILNGTGLSLVVSDPIRSAKRQLLCARELMDSGRIGKVTMARTRCAMPMALNYEHIDSFDPALSGGGILWDLGCHSIHMLNILLGRPEKVHAAFGVMSMAAMEYGVEDNAAIIYEFENGVLGIAETSAVAERREDFFLVSGTEGSICCMDKELRFRTAGGEWVTIAPDIWPEEKDYPLYTWIDSIWNKETITEGGIEDAVTYTEMISSAYKASRQFVTV